MAIEVLEVLEVLEMVHVVPVVPVVLGDPVLLVVHEDLVAPGLVQAYRAFVE